MATTIFFSEADPASVVTDGTAARSIADPGVAWSTLRNGNGTIADSSTATNPVFILASTTSNQWKQINRNQHFFDTVILGSDTISSARLEAEGSSKADGLGISPDINVFGQSKTDSDTTIANAHYENSLNVAFSTAITFAGFSTSVPNVWNFNAAGLASINGAGPSRYSLRNANYDVADIAPSWTSNLNSNFFIHMADQVGQEPQLIVVHSADVNVLATVDALELTEHTASVSLDKNIVAAVDALELTEYPATIGFDVNVLATVDNLILTTYAASIDDGLLPRNKYIPKAVQADSSLAKPQKVVIQ